MKKLRNKTDTRKKILKVAKRFFAKKGFVLTTVDDIAQNAGVNVAVLYYYFRDKESILESVVKESLIEFKEQFCIMNKKHFESIHNQKNDEPVKEILNELLDFVCKDQRLAKIIFEQTLSSNGDGRASLFPIYSEIYDLDYSKSDDNIDLILSIFFFHIFPIIHFAIFHKKLAKDFGVNREKIKERFIQQYAPFYLNISQKFVDC